MHKICKNLSKNKITNVVINFDQIEKQLIFYHKKILRPMIVVFIGTINDWNEFKKLTNTLTMSYPIWVVIFSTNDNDICKKCKKPNLNEFNLKYDTEFVVFCCDYNNTDEWWSQDGHTIGVFPVSHIVDGKMHWVHNNSLFFRRYRVMKRAVRVATVAVIFNLVNNL